MFFLQNGNKKHSPKTPKLNYMPNETLKLIKQTNMDKVMIMLLKMKDHDERVQFWWDVGDKIHEMMDAESERISKSKNKLPKKEA